MAWPDLVSFLSTAALAIGAVGGTLGIVLTILKIREYWIGRPKAIAAHLAPKLRELRRMLLLAKADEALDYWRREFFLKGHRDDLLRMTNENIEIVANMGLLDILFAKNPDDAHLLLRGLYVSALPQHFGMDAETFAQSLTDPSRSQIWQKVAGCVVAQIDKVLLQAEAM